ncbi:MAG: hypothetical protein ACTSPI_00460 [Candidatus Heimdallarchaeaceae archaeon]
MKYESKLITASLLNSFNWYNTCPVSWREKAFYDLTNYLNRAPFEPNDYMKLGQEYENQVQKLSQGMKVDNLMPTAANMAKLVAGGTWQVKIKGRITIDEQKYFLSGRIDVLKKGEIIDIKTTQEYKGEDKYLGTTQHLLYLYSAHSQNWKHNIFKYLVSDFKEIHEVKFEVNDWELLRIEVHRIISEFLTFLNKHPELRKAYDTVFCY